MLLAIAIYGLTVLNNADAMRRLFADLDWSDTTGNLETGDIYPDRLASIVRADGTGLMMRVARWGLPSWPQLHSASGIDRGATNVRNPTSPHWRRWLGHANRCLVPLTRFAERRSGKGAGVSSCRDACQVISCLKQSSSDIIE